MIRCLLVSFCLWLWSFTALADDTMMEQALTNSTEQALTHFYLHMNYTNTRFYHRDSLFAIWGHFDFEGKVDDMYHPPMVKIALYGNGDNEVYEVWITATSFRWSTTAEGRAYRTMTFNMPSTIQAGNITHWPANATLLAMTYTDVYGVSRSVVLHNTSQPFGKVYYRPTLFSLMPYLHQTWTRDWLLNGTGLEGARTLTLTVRGSDYSGPHDVTTVADIVSTFPLASNHVHLRLKPGKRWADFDGAKITVMTLNTGAGPVIPSDDTFSGYYAPLVSITVPVFADPPAPMRSRIMKERLVPMSWTAPRLMYASTTDGTSTSATLTIRGNALQPPPTTSTAPYTTVSPDSYYQTLFNQPQQWSMDFYHLQRLILTCTGAAGSSSDAIVYQLQEGVDYITDRERSTANKRVLTLLPGASWCPPSLYVASIPTNVENATPRFTTRNEPQLLRLLAVESPYRGYFIAVNPANFVAGAAMAMVVWPPTIYPKRVSQIPRLAIIGRPPSATPSRTVGTSGIPHDRRTFWISGRYFPVNTKVTPASTDSPRPQTTSSIITSSNVLAVGSNRIVSPQGNATWTSPPPPTTTFRVRFNRPLMSDRDYTLEVVSSSRVRISFSPRFLETSHQQSDVWVGPLYVTHVKVGVAATATADGDGSDALLDGDAPLFAESLVGEEERAERRERLCGRVVAGDDRNAHLSDNDLEDAYEACLAYMEEVSRGMGGDRELDGADGWITLANGGVYVAELMYATEGDDDYAP